MNKLFLKNKIKKIFKIINFKKINYQKDLIMK